MGHIIYPQEEGKGGSSFLRWSPTHRAHLRMNSSTVMFTISCVKIIQGIGFTHVYTYTCTSSYYTPTHTEDRFWGKYYLRQAAFHRQCHKNPFGFRFVALLGISNVSSTCRKSKIWAYQLSLVSNSYTNLYS